MLTPEDRSDPITRWHAIGAELAILDTQWAELGDETYRGRRDALPAELDELEYRFAEDWLARGRRSPAEVCS